MDAPSASSCFYMEISLIFVKYLRGKVANTVVIYDFVSNVQVRFITNVMIIQSIILLGQATPIGIKYSGPPPLFFLRVWNFRKARQNACIGSQVLENTHIGLQQIMIILAFQCHD